MTTTTLSDSILSWLGRQTGFLTPSRVAAGVHSSTETVRAALNGLVEADQVVFTGNGANRRFRVRRDSDLRSLSTEQLAEQHTLDVADLYSYGFDYDEDTRDRAWELLQDRAKDGDEDALEFLDGCIDD